MLFEYPQDKYMFGSVLAVFDEHSEDITEAKELSSVDQLCWCVY